LKKGPTPRNEVTAETKISFRVTPDERSKIKKLAEAQELPLAVYCRNKALT
jgi:hypothetical protein